MFNSSGLIAVVAVAAIYSAIIWVSISAIRWRINRRARTLATALERIGARVSGVQPSEHIWKPARIEFELGGKRARIEMRRWGRDSDLVSVCLDARPMPSIWVRRERVFDRMGKAVGLEREVQLGDKAFDDAVYIASAAPDQVVRDVLGTSAVRDLVLGVIQSGYSVIMSKDGLRASTLTWWGNSYDSGAVAPIMASLEQLAAALPETDAALASSLHVPRSPFSVIFPAVFGSMFVMALVVVGGRELAHPPIDNGDIVKGLLFGLALWFPAVFFAARRLRNRPLAVLELVFVAIALLCVVPFLGGYLLFGLNSQLDHAAATHRRVHVLDYYKRNTHTVWVESWVPGRDREKVIVPWSIPVVSIGDTLEFDTHPGALGWTWVTDIRRAE